MENDQPNLDPKIINLTCSVGGESLRAWHFGCAPQKIIFLGGVHGDEIEGVWLTQYWIKGLTQKKIKLNPNFEILILPECNPDGVKKKTRQNLRGVDLNRNLPTRDWTNQTLSPKYFPGTQPASEPETVALMHYIEDQKPLAIMSVHSYEKTLLNLNGPAHAWGEHLAQKTNLMCTEDMGYPTPGCLGTYAGVEKKIPTITLEIKRGLSQDEVILRYGLILEETITFYSQTLLGSKK